MKKLFLALVVAVMLISSSMAATVSIRSGSTSTSISIPKSLSATIGVTKMGTFASLTGTGNLAEVHDQTTNGNKVATSAKTIGGTWTYSYSITPITGGMYGTQSLTASGCSFIGVSVQGSNLEGDGAVAGIQLNGPNAAISGYIGKVTATNNRVDVSQAFTSASSPTTGIVTESSGNGLGDVASATTRFKAGIITGLAERAYALPSVAGAEISKMVVSTPAGYSSTQLSGKTMSGLNFVQIDVKNGKLTLPWGTTYPVAYQKSSTISNYQNAVASFETVGLTAGYIMRNTIYSVSYDPFAPAAVTKTGTSAGTVHNMAYSGVINNAYGDIIGVSK